MAQTLSFSPLSLDLPNSRMSVDFSSFISSQPKPNSRPLRTDKPHPLLPQHQTVPRRAISRPLPLPNVKEEPDVPPSVPSRQPSRKWVWGRSLPRQPEPALEPLSRTHSSASTTSHTSVASTAVSSVFSNAQTLSTARTSQSSLKYTKTLDTYQEEPLNLTSLPLSLLEHIIEYTLCVPLNVSIGPQNSENRHMQYRYHRAGLDYIDIQLILKHPIFMVSHHLRDVALDVFHRKCDFVIDLHRIYHTKVSSTINENLRKHQKFWVNETPKMVRDTLRNLSKLHLRLPVPSCENGGHRGRDEHDWMDGSDGKGGGGWKIKSLKREQEDAAGVQKCLESVMKLVMTDPVEETESRGRNSGLSRTGSLRRSISRARSRSRSRDRRASSRAQSMQSTRDEGDGKRQPLKRLEVTLVKRNPYVMVLPETLAQIKVLRSTPVTGFTKYFFELESQKILWATKYRKRWKGFEPDGTRLLNDLQGITVAEKPIEPIRTPTEFKFVNVGKDKKLQLSEHLMPKTPIILEKHPTERDFPNVPAVPSNSKLPRKPLPWSRKKANKRRDSFALMMDDGMEELGTSGTETSGRVNAPTVDELRKIVEDIRNGLY